MRAVRGQAPTGSPAPSLFAARVALMVSCRPAVGATYLRSLSMQARLRRSPMSRSSGSQGWRASGWSMVRGGSYVVSGSAKITLALEVVFAVSVVVNVVMLANLGSKTFINSLRSELT